MAQTIGTKSDEPGIRQIDLNKEILLGALASYAYVLNDAPYLRALPRHIDDAERDFGAEIYEKMSRDPALASALSAIRVQVVSDGPRFLNPVSAPDSFNPDPEQQAKYDKAEEIRSAVERMFDELQQPFEEVLEELLIFLSEGHVVAEQTYKPDGGLLKLKTLRVKPRYAYSFVADQYMNILGLVPRLQPGAWLISSNASIAADEVIERKKFLILSYMPTHGDPRGHSLLRPAYNAWWLKQQTWPHYLKFLLQFGTPSVAGILPENAGEAEIYDEKSGKAITDSDGNTLTVGAAEALLQKLIAWSNGTAIALDHGTQLQLIESEGDGEAYVKAIDLYDRQMTSAVLIAIRATMEAQHGSKADSGTAQDILGSFAQLVKRRIEMGIYRDVIKPLVEYNWGLEAAQTMCPCLSLSDVAKEDVVAFGNMIANLSRSPGLIDSSQYPGLDAKLGLPERDYASQMARENAEQQQTNDVRNVAYGIGSPQVV